MIELATLIDNLVTANHAFVGEASDVVTVSNLGACDARSVLELCISLDCGDGKAYDNEGHGWSVAELRDDLSPFSVRVRKPTSSTGSLWILTNAGFTNYLKSSPAHQFVHVARIGHPIQTLSTNFQSWGEPRELFEPATISVGPHSIVREYGQRPTAPSDIRPWLLRERTISIPDDSVFQIWANAAIRMTLRALSDEISPSDQKLIFKGPPRLNLMQPSDFDDVVRDFGEANFMTLQSAAAWVFINNQDVEARHIFLANEIARSGHNSDATIQSLGENIVIAWEGARIAYQMSLSQTSRDTIKVLAELRKAVTEEVAKVTELTRQLIAATAGSLAIGIGLLVTRITTNTPALYLIAIMLVAGAYFLLVSLSGAQFMTIQRNLRRDWQPRLYRFLPNDEYERMVTTPAGQAECSFWWATAIGALAIFIMAGIVTFSSLTTGEGSGGDIASPVANRPFVRRSFHVTDEKYFLSTGLSRPTKKLE